MQKYITKKTHILIYKENKIYYNAFIKDPRSIEAGFKTNMTGFLHEAGHYLDYNLSKDGKPLHTKMKDLEYFLKKDALDFINKIYRGKLGKQAVDFKNLSIQELKNGLDFYRKLGDIKGVDFTRLVANELLKNREANSAVSDLLEGLTGGKLAGKMLNGYGHLETEKLNYWKSSNSTIKKEAVAHLFEAIGSGGNRLKAIKSAFPFTFTYFLKFL